MKSILQQKSVNQQEQICIPLKHVLMEKVWHQIVVEQQLYVQPSLSEMLCQLAQTLPCMTCQMLESMKLPDLTLVRPAITSSSTQYIRQKDHQTNSKILHRKIQNTLKVPWYRVHKEGFLFFSFSGFSFWLENSNNEIGNTQTTHMLRSTFHMSHPKESQQKRSTNANAIKMDSNG